MKKKVLSQLFMSFYDAFRPNFFNYNFIQNFNFPKNFGIHAFFYFDV